MGVEANGCFGDEKGEGRLLYTGQKSENVVHNTCTSAVRSDESYI